MVMENNPDAIVARINLFGWSHFGNRSLAEWFFYNLQAGKPVKGFTDVFFCTQLVNDLAGVLIPNAITRPIRVIPCSRSGLCEQI